MREAFLIAGIWLVPIAVALVFMAGATRGRDARGDRTVDVPAEATWRDALFGDEDIEAWATECGDTDYLKRLP